MAIASTFRSAVHSTTAATSYATTASFTPAAGSLMIAIVMSVGDANECVAVSGNGVTYTKLAAIARSINGNMTFWAGIAGGSPSAGVVTASGWGSNRTGCHVVVIEVTGAYTAGGVANAFRQFVSNTGGTTSASLTLAAAEASVNRPMSAFEHNSNEVTTPATNWTELDDGMFASPTTGMDVQFRSDAFDTAAAASWATSSQWCAIATEIRDATYTPPAGASVTLIQDGMG